MYDLLSSHGAVEDVVFFAMLMKGKVDTHYRSHILKGAGELHILYMCVNDTWNKTKIGLIPTLQRVW